LPGELGALQQTWILILAGILYVIEFAADKIPAVESAWDAIHTFIRIPAGAVLAASAFASFDPSVRWMALLAGGGVALSSHGAKAATRVAVNTSPEPFSNIALSLLEDAFTIGTSVLMTMHPVIVLVIVVVFVVAAVLIARRILRALMRLFERRAPVPG
jgi:hypothetical protein